MDSLLQPLLEVCLDKAVVVFGDVHGRSDKLLALFDLAYQRYPGMELQFHTLGDLIDRGPDSKGVLDLCVEHQVQGIIGNHELWFLHALSPQGVVEDAILAPIMGSVETLYSWDVDVTGTPENRAAQLRAGVTAGHRMFLSGLDLIKSIHAGGKFWYLIHAGVTKSLYNRVASVTGPIYDDGILLKVLAQSFHESILWSSPDLKNMHRFQSGVQILGHKPISKPIIEDHFVALDTGCGTCHPNKLSALIILPDGSLENLSV